MIKHKNIYTIFSKVYITIVLLLFCLKINAQTINPNGFNTFYYENGVKSSEGTMREGKPDGYWKNYYTTGILKNEGNRKNYQLDSTWKFYNEKGKIKTAINYANDKKNGFTINYDTLGNIISKENYVNDIKQLNSYTYFKSGKTKQIIPYKNNRIEGISYEFNEDSVIIGIYKYRAGFIESSEKINRVDEKGNKQGLWKEFYPDGTVKTEIKYRDGVKDGYVKNYDKKGSLITMEKFDNGVEKKNAKELAKLDVFQAYNEDGVLKYEGGYINGFPVGTHYRFVSSREICDTISIYDDTITIKQLKCFKIPVPDSAIVYEDGYLIEKGAVDSNRIRRGVWKEYYLTGELKGTGKYLNNNKVDVWNYYYESGKPELSGKIDKKGRQQGEWIWVYENGQTRRKDNYLNGKREGLSEEFYEDGKLITAGEYSDDLKNGFWTYEMNNYKEQGNYVLDQPDSIWIAKYVNTDKLYFKGNFINGEPEGLHQYYYENGKLRMSGKYSGGMKQGDWNFYDEFGFLSLTIYFENDEEVKWNGQKVDYFIGEGLKVFENKTPKSKDKDTTEENKE